MLYFWKRQLFKMRKTILFFLIIAMLTAGCEKDDICTEGITPLLIIRFYDIDNPNTIKKVTNLQVTGSEKSSPLSNINRVDKDSIAIPLKSFSDNTNFIFINNSADDNNGNETGNTDTITFTYTSKEIFISRACGYIANYTNLNNQLSEDSDNWIKSVTIENNTINNQSAAHVKIYH